MAWKRVNNNGETGQMALTPDIVRHYMALAVAKVRRQLLKTIKKAEELKSDKGFVFKVWIFAYYIISFLILIFIYSGRHFRIWMASEKGYTITLFFKRPLT